MRIKDLPEGERPRERMKKFGPGVLSISELLAILFRTGTSGSSRETALSLANRVLNRFGGNLLKLMSATLPEFESISGIGTAKASTLAACFELSKRLSGYTSDTCPVIKSPADVANLLMGDMRYEKQESFKVLLMDTKNRVSKIQTISQGSLNQSLVHPREVFRTSILECAASVILAHNHPSGDPVPSREDKMLTQQLVEAGELVGIPVLDHVIIGNGNFISMKERGFMK